MSEPKHVAGWYYLKDWGSPDPDDGGLCEALHTARYSLASLNQTQAYRILAAAEAYCHFAGHPASNKMILSQLATLRSSVRRARLSPEPKEGKP